MAYDFNIGVELDISPGDDEEFEAPYTLGDVELLLHFQWLPRLSSWRLYTKTASGEVIAASRVTPNGVLWPDLTDPRLPRGALVCVGVDPYRREELGGAVKIGFAPEAP